MCVGRGAAKGIARSNSITAKACGDLYIHFGLVGNVIDLIRHASCTSSAGGTVKERSYGIVDRVLVWVIHCNACLAIGNIRVIRTDRYRVPIA